MIFRLCIRYLLSDINCSRTFHTNGYLSTTTIFFGGQSVHSLLFQPLYNDNLSKVATFFCPAKVAVVERFNCIIWIPSVISCTFSFFPAFCFLPGDSSVIIKSILYNSVSKNSLRNRHTVKPCLYRPIEATWQRARIVRGMEKLG